MNRYICYCTEEQTKMALELGAPLREVFYDVQSPEIAKQYNLLIIDFKLYCIPTAEQMIGWLEEQEEISVDILYVFGWTFNIWYFTLLHVHSGNVYDTRKEATLAAIDDALKYLTNQKQSKI